VLDSDKSEAWFKLGANTWTWLRVWPIEARICIAIRLGGIAFSVISYFSATVGKTLRGVPEGPRH